MALARLAALHVLSRGDVPEERDLVRASLDGDLLADFDAALAEHANDAAPLRRRLGVPEDPPVTRRALDDSPLAELDDETLERAEQAYQERRRFFNRGQRVYAVIERRKSMGVVLTIVPSLMVMFATGVPLAWALPLLAIGGSVGAVWGHKHPLLRCSDPDCRCRLGSTDSTCPFCGGSIVGQLRSANERLDHDE
ncbi:hypothetical protein [Paraliomyxa miuraensis]|uniref:hypothetical protein n=1 Tax=Paraliomyxa miuraensis TaxID=376150 RepID=UPI002258B63D|nr:hypothetical protein [Paraliomyxa miuraensis]MCX4239106.1 hypothetical protein [Paraliomyxa miuraensis]